MASTLFSPGVDTLIDLAISEDLSSGDVTSDAVFAMEVTGQATFRAKQPMVLAGEPVVERVMARVDPALQVSWHARDGQRIGKGAFGTVSGPVRSLLRAERTALNFLRKLSGVATAAWEFQSELRPGNTRLLDTRKTTPGFRELEKYAVRMGGAFNHRVNLGAGAMIKNNHIDAAGSIAEAVARVRARLPFLAMVEVEVRDEDEAAAAVAAGADALLLDNMDTETMARIVARFGAQTRLEASGNITRDRLRELAPIGLHYVSSGWITHSSPAADISLTVGGRFPLAPVLETLAQP